MSITPDLHPDDAAHRLWLFAELRRLREETGLSKAAVGARMGLSADSIRRVECLPDPNTLLMTVQRHARSVDHIAIPTLHGIQLPPVTAYSRVLEHLTYSMKPELADAAFRALMIDRLSEARRARRPKLSTKAFALLSGLKQGALFHLESQTHEALVSSYQRYARGLGGWMTVELQPLELVAVGMAA